jgi:hypothetical protein
VCCADDCDDVSKSSKPEGIRWRGKGRRRGGAMVAGLDKTRQDKTRQDKTHVGMLR